MRGKRPSSLPPTALQAMAKGHYIPFLRYAGLLGLFLFPHGWSCYACLPFPMVSYNFCDYGVYGLGVSPGFLRLSAFLCKEMAHPATTKELIVVSVSDPPCFFSPANSCSSAALNLRTAVCAPFVFLKRFKGQPSRMRNWPHPVWGLTVYQLMTP